MKAAKQVLSSGLLGALFEDGKYEQIIEEVGDITDEMALFFKKIEETVEEMTDGKSNSVY